MRSNQLGFKTAKPKSGSPARAVLASIPVAMLVSSIGGFTLALGFRCDAWWLMVLPWLAGLMGSLIGRTFASALLIGLAGGAAFWLSLIHWITLYLGPVPWLALGVLMSLYVALAAGLIALVFSSERRFRGLWHRLGILPIAVASIWVLRELLASTWPYGGFSWGRVPMALIHSPLSEAYSWIGANGVALIAVWIVVFAIQLVRIFVIEKPETPEPAKPRLQRAVPAGVLLGVILTVTIVPAWKALPNGTARILAVQGGVDASLFTQINPGEVLQAHATETLSHRDESGEKAFDIIVWPENSADVDPLRYPSAERVVNGVVDLMGAPLLLGAITARDELRYNSSILWEPKLGPTEIYDKRHPVPFAEYVPDRWAWRPFAPDLIDMVSRDYEIGSTPNTLKVSGFSFGAAICFDIADDSLVAEMMHGGAEVILAQTNNADFGRTEQSRQQFDIARMRALETGRTVLNISTVGVSGLALPNGSVQHELPTWTRDSFTAEVELVEGTPPSLVASPVLLVLSSLGALWTLSRLLWTRKGTQQQPQPQDLSGQ